MASTKGINKSPVVVTKPGGRTGGTNPSVKPVTNPTKYTGGKNSFPKVKGK
jgi:hypothetical protein